MNFTIVQVGARIVRTNRYAIEANSEWLSVSQKAEVPPIAFEFKNTSQSVTYFRAMLVTTIFLGYRSSSWNTGVYLSTTCTYPAIELARVKQTLTDVDSFGHHTYYDVVLLDKLFYLDFPVMDSFTYSDVAEYGLIICFCLLVGGQVTVEEVDTITLVIWVPSETLLTYKD